MQCCCLLFPSFAWKSVLRTNDKGKIKILSNKRNVSSADAFKMLRMWIFFFPFQSDFKSICSLCANKKGKSTKTMSHNRSKLVLQQCLQTNTHSRQNRRLSGTRSIACSINSYVHSAFLTLFHFCIIFHAFIGLERPSIPPCHFFFMAVRCVLVLFWLALWSVDTKIKLLFEGVNFRLSLD